MRDAICGHRPRTVTDEYETPTVEDMAVALAKFPRYEVSVVRASYPSAERNLNASDEYRPDQVGLAGIAVPSDPAEATNPLGTSRQVQRA
jgi:hypothetical protein